MGFLFFSQTTAAMAEVVEKLSPKHPDWVWLQSPGEQLMAERSAPFDPKTECWVSDPDLVYVKATITGGEDPCDIQTENGNTLSLPKAEVLECNPPKFFLEEDMSNLSSRYQRLQIYTYSGLFCICINPYKWLM